MNLRGKNVLITGAAKRIGREIALSFAKRGAHILIHYHSSKKEAEELADQIRSLKVKCSIYQADLSKLPEVKKMSRKIIWTKKENISIVLLAQNRKGILDPLVSAAGAMRY